ncbi:hypothetical protein EVAR_39475_1 [Eumeta japonica]|uniref:Uncharacterized protein n=1 Tax=Eumeta variegata TaxID=151549 RepID=A0A4C1W2X7_EUMVA|nr:hypothetical protein EVAR_39475_1 [Eumeta japonica]
MTDAPRRPAFAPRHTVVVAGSKTQFIHGGASNGAISIQCGRYLNAIGLAGGAGGGRRPRAIYAHVVMHILKYNGAETLMPASIACSATSYR